MARHAPGVKPGNVTDCLTRKDQAPRKPRACKDTKAPAASRTDGVCDCSQLQIPCAPDADRAMHRSQRMDGPRSIRSLDCLQSGHSPSRKVPGAHDGDIVGATRIARCAGLQNERSNLSGSPCRKAGSRPSRSRPRALDRGDGWAAAVRSRGLHPCMGPRKYGPRLLAAAESGFHSHVACDAAGSALTTATRRVNRTWDRLATDGPPEPPAMGDRPDRDASKDPGKKPRKGPNFHHPQGDPKDDAATTRKGRRGDGRDAPGNWGGCPRRKVRDCLQPRIVRPGRQQVAAPMQIGDVRERRMGTPDGPRLNGRSAAARSRGLHPFAAAVAI